MTDNRPVVFLSHSTKDEELARKIAIDLQHAGIVVWLDKWHIRIGESITQCIQKGLDVADFVAVIITSSSLESGWVEREWQSKIGKEAAEKKVVILPLKGDQCEMPALLADKKYADFSHDYETAIAALKASINDLFREYHREAPSVLEELAVDAARIANATSLFTEELEKAAPRDEARLKENSRERQLLKCIYKKLCLLEIYQTSVPSLLRQYSKSAESSLWGTVRTLLAELSDTVSELIDSLLIEESELAVDEPQEYKDLLKSLSERKVIYDTLATADAPSAPEDLTILSEIAGRYEELIVQLKKSAYTLIKYLGGAPDEKFDTHDDSRLMEILYRWDSRHPTVDACRSRIDT